MSKSAKNGHFWPFSTFSLFLTKIAKFFFCAYFGLNFIFEKTKSWNRSKFREGVKGFAGQKWKNDDFGPFFVISPSASSVKLEIGRSKNRLFSKKKCFLRVFWDPFFSRKIDFWEKVIFTPCFNAGERNFKKWFFRYQNGALQRGVSQTCKFKPKYAEITIFKTVLKKYLGPIFGSKITKKITFFGTFSSKYPLFITLYGNSTFRVFLGYQNHPEPKWRVKKGSFLAIFRDFRNFGSETAPGEWRGSKKCFYETILGQKWPFFDPFWTCFWRVWTLFGSFFFHFLAFLEIPERFRPEFFKTEKTT